MIATELGARKKLVFSTMIFPKKKNACLGSAIVISLLPLVVEPSKVLRLRSKGDSYLG